MSSDNKKFEILFFYSTSKYESIKTKIILNNYLISNSIVKKDVLQEIDFDNNIELCKKHKVTGVPTTMVFINNNQVYRHLGDLSNKELDSLFEKMETLNK